MESIIKTHLKDEMILKIRERGFWREMPEREIIAANFISELFKYLFPISDNCLPEQIQLEQRYLYVYKLFRQLYQPVLNKGCNTNETLESAFFEQLPNIYDQLIEDAKAIFDGDPAAQSIDEVIHIYPGFFGIFIYRIANTLFKLKMPLIARMLSEYAHSKTGIDIHPGAAIGRSFSIDHGTGIVIGETSIIGNNVKFYQGVTLGAKSVDKELVSTKRHPTIQDSVVIYAGATILGGNTIIGHDSVIGGNVFITHSIQANSLVYYKNEIAIKPLCTEVCEHEYSN